MSSEWHCARPDCSFEPIHYHGSEVGSCPRVLGATRLGYEAISFSEDEKTLLEEGLIHEGLIVSRLEAKGYTFTDRGRELVLDTPLYSLLMHIDGIAHRNGADYLFEAKALGRFTFAQFLKNGLSAFPQYEWQVSAYWSKIPLPILMAVKCRDTGKLIVQIHDEPSVSIQTIVSKLEEVEAYAREGELIPHSCSEKEWVRCRFRYLCPRGEPEPSQVAILPNLVEAARTWREAQEVKDIADDMVERAKATFLAHCKETGNSKFWVEGVSVSYHGLRDKTYLDEKVLKELVPEEVWQKAVKKTRPWEDISIRLAQERRP